MKVAGLGGSADLTSEYRFLIDLRIALPLALVSIGLISFLVCRNGGKVVSSWCGDNRRPYEPQY